MIDAEKIREIIKQYEKHGWTLRRVLLSAPTREHLSANLTAPENLFGGAPIINFDTDALWFSRFAANGCEAWEIRRLSGAPFSLVKVFGADTDETERERVRRETEKALLSGKRG